MRNSMLHILDPQGRGQAPSTKTMKTMRMGKVQALLFRIDVLYAAQWPQQQCSRKAPTVRTPHVQSSSASSTCSSSSARCSTYVPPTGRSPATSDSSSGSAAVAPPAAASSAAVTPARA